MVDIIIATNKKYEQLEKQIIDIKENTDTEFNIIATCQDASAAINRNYGVNKSTSDIVVMIDDDIFGFYPGWVKDLTAPLIQDNEIGVISARLMDDNGKPGIMHVYGRSETLRPGVLIKEWGPSACIAMRKKDLILIKECSEYPFNIPFDENYKRACYEDTDLLQVYKVFLKKKFAVNNYCKLQHKNNESWRPGFRWEDNRDYFQKKWGFTP